MSIEQNLYEEKFEKIFPLKPVLNAIACITESIERLLSIPSGTHTLALLISNKGRYSA